jgi:conjugative relaxase-like TrwC/TraI family protein
MIVRHRKVSRARDFVEYLHADTGGDYGGYLVGGTESKLARRLGAGSVRIGLAEVVSQAEMSAIGDGVNPVSGERFRPPLKEHTRRSLETDEHGRVIRDEEGEAVVKETTVKPQDAFTWTWSPPKDVSLLWLASKGNRAAQDAIERAVWESVEEAIRYVEMDMISTIQGGKYVTGQTGGLVGAGVMHYSTRPLGEEGEADIQLHVHALIANAVECIGGEADGDWRGLQQEEIMGRAVKAIGSVAGCVLQRRLSQEFNVAWVPRDIRGERFWGIDGIDQIERDAISRSSTRLDKAQEAYDLSPGQRTLLQANLRSPKRADYTDGKIADECWSRLEEIRDPREMLAATFRPDADLVRVDIDGVVDRIISAEGITGKRATFDRNDLTQRIHAEVGAASVDEIRLIEQRVLEICEEGVTLLDGSEASGLIRPSDRSPRRDRFATPQNLVAEDRFFASASALTGMMSKSELNEARLRDALPALCERLGFEPSSEQQDAIIGQLASASPIAIVNAIAGSGKTTTLKGVVGLLAAAGYERNLIVAAPDHIKRRNADLAVDGITAQTVQSLVVGIASGARQLSPSDVLIVDEAGAVGMRDLAVLTVEVERSGARLIMTGDDQQLAPVTGASGMRALVDRGLTTCVLSDIRRQKGASMIIRADGIEHVADDSLVAKIMVDQQLAIHLDRQGEHAEADRILRKLGMLETLRRPGDLASSLTRDFRNLMMERDSGLAPGDFLCATTRNSTAAKLNVEFQSILHTLELVGDEILTTSHGLVVREGDILSIRTSENPDVPNGSFVRAVGGDVDLRTLKVEVTEEVDGEKITRVETLSASIIDGTIKGDPDTAPLPTLRGGYVVTTQLAQSLSVETMLAQQARSAPEAFVQMTRNTYNLKLYATPAWTDETQRETVASEYVREAEKAIAENRPLPVVVAPTIAQRDWYTEAIQARMSERGLRGGANQRNVGGVSVVEGDYLRVDGEDATVKRVPKTGLVAERADGVEVSLTSDDLKQKHLVEAAYVVCDVEAKKIQADRVLIVPTEIHDDEERIKGDYALARAVKTIRFDEVDTEDPRVLAEIEARISARVRPESRPALDQRAGRREELDYQAWQQTGLRRLSATKIKDAEKRERKLRELALEEDRRVRDTLILANEGQVGYVVNAIGSAPTNAERREAWDAAAEAMISAHVRHGADPNEPYGALNSSDTSARAHAQREAQKRVLEAQRRTSATGTHAKRLIDEEIRVTQSLTVDAA